MSQSLWSDWQHDTARQLAHLPVHAPVLVIASAVDKFNRTWALCCWQGVTGWAYVDTLWTVVQ